MRLKGKVEVIGDFAEGLLDGTSRVKGCFAMLFSGGRETGEGLGALTERSLKARALRRIRGAARSMAASERKSSS